MSAHDYRYGQFVCLVKLGMVGAIDYKQTENRTPGLGAARNSESVWRNFDTRSATTGDESSSTIPAEIKTGTENDLGYGSAEGAFGIGGYDADKDRIDVDQRIQDAIRQAFESNRLYDMSYGAEPAMTQPHGSDKVGMVAAPGIRPPTAGREGVLKSLGTATKGLTQNMNSMMGIKPPKLPSMSGLATQNKLQQPSYDLARQQVNSTHPIRLDTPTPTITGGGPSQVNRQ